MRVIAGDLKGRRLKPPTWDGLRPTSDKLRETLFNVLAGRVAGARVLDFYAGTGAIGIEALSRGASHVTFIDNDPRALKLIEENLRQCGLAGRPQTRQQAPPESAAGRYAIIRTPQSLATASFDLAVLDPPYDEPDLSSPIAAAEPLIAPGGLVVLEHARRRLAPQQVGRLNKTRDLLSGDSALAFYAASV
jgi:16S rRNA (guanine(966)-N(2))-methyltransferase RsmD